MYRPAAGYGTEESRAPLVTVGMEVRFARMRVRIMRWIRFEIGSGLGFGFGRSSVEGQGVSKLRIGPGLGSTEGAHLILAKDALAVVVHLLLECSGNLTFLSHAEQIEHLHGRAAAKGAPAKQVTNAML